MFKRITFLSTLLALTACVLGDQATAISPYESAYFETTQASAVGDGITPVSVIVRGDYGVTLTLEVSGAEFFGSNADELLKEKTVQLLDIDEEGNASTEVQLVSASPGLARLAFKLAPLAATLELEFLPVQIEVGAPFPVELRPGVVVHEVCLYANTSHGMLRTTTTSGSIFPASVELQSASESPCGVGNPSLPGSALVQWSSSVADARLDVAYQSTGEEALSTATLELHGEAFPGYRVILHGVEIADEWASVRTQLAYEATDNLPSETAASVPLHDLRSIPEGLKLVGSSSGSENSVPETDATGMVTLYFQVPQSSPPLSVFATPLGGGTAYLGEIGAP